MKPSPHRNAIPRNGGFTLLEITIAMGVFFLLVIAVFALVGGSSELMEEVSELQSRDSLRRNLVETLRANFSDMPASSQLEFDYVQSRSNYNTYLSFVNAPGAFDFGFTSRDEIERSVLAAEIRPDGYIRAGVYYLTAGEFAQAKRNGFQDIEAPYVELVPRLRQLSWSFYDTASKTWRKTLDGNFQSSLVEVKMRLPDDTEPISSVFWHPLPQR